jgi:hypothetical protein
MSRVAFSLHVILPVKNLHFTTALTLLCLMGNAQERPGISNSNYYPVNSIFLNPSSSVDNRVHMQFNLVGLNVFAKTNVGYLPGFSVWGIGGTSLSSVVLSESKTQKFAYATATLEGPSLLISKGRFSGGYFMRANTIANLRRLPYEIPGFIMGNMPDAASSGSFYSKNAGFSNMSWFEYGINFGMMLRRTKSDLLTGGINIKYINGVNILYANVDEVSGSYDISALRLDTLRGRVRYNSAMPASGSGVAGDIGLSYMRPVASTENYLSHSARSNCKYIDYHYKIAFSLRDLGYTKFGNTSVSDINGSAVYFSDQADRGYQPYLDAITNTTFVTAPVTAYLPASASAQFDYNFGNYIYLNATVVKNLLPHTFVGVQRADLVSFAPRYETRYFEVALPVTLHRFIYPQVGFGLRFRSFVIGMDNMLPLFMPVNTYGVNAYFNLALTIFRNPACRSIAPRVADCAPKLKRGGNYRRAGFLRRLFRFGKTHSR